MLRVGVPKEIKPQEFRVGLTAEAVREFCSRGIHVTVETGAGEGIAAADDDYRAAGAEIVASAEQVFSGSDLIIKVKEPQASELSYLRPQHILFTYLHLAPDREQTLGLLKSGCSAIAYETVTDASGALPLLAPMSEVAGRLSVDAAQSAMRPTSGGAGKLLGGVPGVPPARIAIIGGGIVGTQAARMAVGLGASVSVIDRSTARLRYLDDMFQGRLQTRYSTVQGIEEEVAAADVVIGAVLVAGARAPKLVTREMIRKMRPGSVLVDVAIDQGGAFETSHPTTHASPTFIVDGIVHYCVANMPGAVPRTATYALNNATLPFALALATRGLGAVKDDPHLREGLNVHRGVVTNAAVAQSLGLEFQPAATALQ
jgi:alanine dehydrogenase